MYKAAYIILELHMTNKVVHVFSVEKVIVFDFFLLGHGSLLHHRFTHSSML